LALEVFETDKKVQRIKGDILGIYDVNLLNTSS